MTPLRERNLAFLQARYPRIASLLSQHSAAPELVNTRSGQKSLMVQGDGNEHPLHSMYDPLREAQRWAEQCVPAKGSVLLLIGWGLGYHGAQWLQNHGSIPAGVIIYEPNVEWFNASLDCIDFTSFSPGRNIQFVVGASGMTMYQAMFSQMEHLFSQDYRLLPMPFASMYPPDAMQVVQQQWERIRINRTSMLRHMETLGYQCQTNMIKNIPAMARSLFPRSLQHSGKGKAAIVVAAGPSLDRTIDQLEDAQERAILFCCDTAWPVLCAKEIRPDVVLTKDPTELNRKHLQSVEESESVLLAYDPQVLPDVLSHWKGPLLCMPNRNHMLHQYIRPIRLTQNDPLPLSTNVAIAGFNLAEHMGCEPIAFTGLDLCFAKTAGSSHAQGSALLSETLLDDTQSRLSYSRDGMTDQVDVIQVEGIDGEMYPTTTTFHEALRMLEQRIAESKTEVIDASEGGARIQGTTILSFASLLERLSSSESKSWNISSPEMRNESLREDLRAIATHLEQCEQLAQRGLQQLVNSPESINHADKLRRQIEDGYKIYHCLQSALEPVMAKIGREGYWEDSRSPEEHHQRLTEYFTEIQQACAHFAPLYQQQAEATKNNIF